MRSAKEWEMQIGFESALQQGIIQQIQLDAMKEGMRMAAKLCNEVGDKDDEAKYGSAESCYAIIQASEQLTIKDLP